MKKIFAPLLAIIIVACSSENDNSTTLLEGENNAPVITSGSFAVAEHSQAGISIGSVLANDIDGDELTFTINSDFDLEIDEISGEITTGVNLKLDFEKQQTLAFTVSVFDGKVIVDENFTLSILDIDELTLLNDEQLELIDYFKFLTLWKGPNNNPIDFNQKWKSSMKMFLDGNISNEFNTTVENVISQYNDLTASGDFNIALVDGLAEANAHVFFGSKSEVEDIWPDMYDLIKDGSFDGYAMTPSQNAMLTSTRIWVSSAFEVLFKHELGHALGFGHSDRCEGEKSFLCSTIQIENDILPIEENVIFYLYHNDMRTGLSASEIEQELANILLNE